ncbi:Sporulation integral membrane protein YtvI [[Clostridium] ultunense Esp]|uniref:sporulation integral membrane protein YtvI n=1 Tax=Thermicanus aegyptius TaxID=94009 RepID=UPI0002B70DC4|nr:sporulation integral membrane protein YtvI [Thermicanus aegyptius]CCQ94866.1 Sporulation integral membrane protein YtvI [[Clostridium] ultunense Esp]
MPTLAKLATVSLTLLLLTFFGVILYFLLPYLAPFLFTLVLAVLIEPVNRLLLRIPRMTRAWAVGISNTSLILLITGLLILGGTKIISELNVLLHHLPNLVETLVGDFNTWMERAKRVYFELPPDLVHNLNQSVNSLVEWGKNLLAGSVPILYGIVAGFPGFLILLLVIIVSFILMSYYLPQMKSLFLSLFTHRAQEKVNLILNDLNSAIIGFVGAQILLSSITYIISFAGLIILGVKYALAIAFLIVIVDILPILGTSAVLLPWAAYTFYHGDTRLGIGLILLFLVIAVVRRIIEPQILGAGIGLDPLSTIISLYLGIQLLGGIGIFLGPLLFIVVKSMYKAGLLRFKFDF